jgi:DNA primase
MKFELINAAAMPRMQDICARWLPDGRRAGREWVARNPRRADKSPGSFKVNLQTGRWSDFATGDRGGDVIALAAFLFGLSQSEAARRVADMVGIDAHV